jgi:hypothetical protein
MVLTFTKFVWNIFSQWLTNEILLRINTSLQNTKFSYELLIEETGTKKKASYWAFEKFVYYWRFWFMLYNLSQNNYFDW